MIDRSWAVLGSDRHWTMAFTIWPSDVAQSPAPFFMRSLKDPMPRVMMGNPRTVDSAATLQKVSSL